MVFFTCNFCNESVKKKQVEKHLGMCRRCTSLACVDCGKDFSREAYKAHIKCITEEEKYSGPNYQPKASANKGEKKQEAWTEQVQGAIDRCRHGNGLVKSLLIRLRDHGNVPRKKPKFINFVRNIQHNVQLNVIEQVWALITAGAAQSKEETKEQDKPEEAPAVESEVQPKSKRDRKEERRKEQHKVEKKDIVQQEEDTTEKSKKRAREEEEMDVDEAPKKKKKKSKKSKEENGLTEATKENAAEVEVDQCEKEEEKSADHMANGKLNATLDVEDCIPSGKFDWIEAITKLLSKKGGEMPTNKLWKRVIKQFRAYQELNGAAMSEKKITKTFEKTLQANFVWIDNSVQLKDS